MNQLRFSLIRPVKTSRHLTTNNVKTTVKLFNFKQLPLSFLIKNNACKRHINNTENKKK